MAWNRSWLGVSLLGASGLLLSGCTRDLPAWALPKDTYSADISQKAPPLARSQLPDGPGVGLPKPLMVYAGPSYFERAGAFRPALAPRSVTVLGRGNVNTPGAPAFPGAAGEARSHPS